jgi:hypothetical protein
VERLEYGAAALILTGGSIVWALEIVGAWRTGELVVLWGLLTVRRAEWPGRFLLLMLAWTFVSAGLIWLLLAASVLMGRIALAEIQT